MAIIVRTRFLITLSQLRVNKELPLFSLTDLLQYTELDDNVTFDRF